MLDDIDRLILSHLQDNANVTNVELAQRVQLSPSGMQKRLRRLEEAGLIDGYVALVNREKAGFDLLCFVQVNLEHHDPVTVKAFEQAVLEMPQVLECYHIAGEADFIFKIVARNRQHLKKFLLETLMTAPGIDKMQTNLVLSDTKVTTALPLKDGG
jgi:DNA-binding Lrp family transcriptional regulator